MAALMGLCVLVLLPDLAVGAVGSPRDSSIVMRHGVQSPAPVASTSVQSGIRGVPGDRQRRELPPPCWGPVRPDPGYRPVWIPATRCWTGFESVWVPGHWGW